MEGVRGVFAPDVGGGDDVAERERLLAGGGEEAVNVGLLHGVILGIALALDGVAFLRALGLGNEVDAGVLTGKAELRAADFLGPVGIEPDLGIKIGVTGLIAEMSADEFLKVSARFALYRWLFDPEETGKMPVPLFCRVRGGRSGRRCGARREWNVISDQ